MNELERSLLVLLYEKYKNSKKETGSNIITRRTKISPNVLYKDYNANTADIDKIEAVDNAVMECSKLGFVTVERAPNGKEIKNIYLIDGMINELENYLQSKCGYETKDVKRNFIINLLNKYDNKTPAASAECNKLRKMLEANKYPSRYHQKEELLKSLVFIENNKQDLFLREASLRIFGDSKYFEENVLKMVCKSLRDYLNRPRAEDEVDEEILEEYGIITDKQKICLKGNIVLKIDGKLFDVNVLKGGLMIFNDDVCRIEQIAVNTDNFMTIENYTSWCRFAKKDTVCLYLGGYANRYQRDFLKKIYLDNPNLIAQNGFMALAFEGMPYAMPLEGEEKSVENIKYEDIASYYKNNMKSSYIVAVIAGNFQDDLEGKVKATLSKLEKGSPFTYNCENSFIMEDKYKEVVDTRIQQAKVYIGYNAPDAKSEDYAALKVLTDILGGGMSSRYFTEIRKNSSYAYAVGAGYPSRFCSSRFFVSMGLDYSNVDSAIKKIEEINLNLDKTITEQEIDKAKKSILGSTLMETQSNGSLAWNMAFFETVGLGANYYEKYVDILKNIKKEDLLKAAEIFKGKKAVYILKPENKAKK